MYEMFLGLVGLILVNSNWLHLDGKAHLESGNTEWTECQKWMVAVVKFHKQMYEQCITSNANGCISTKYCISYYIQYWKVHDTIQAVTDLETA